MIICKFEQGNEASPGLRHVVTDVLVLKDDKVLLAKRAEHLTAGGKWAVVGGFVDRDESISEAAKREVLEESGWGIKNLNLFRICDTVDTADDFHRQNVAFVYVAEAIEKIGEPDDESSEQRWFSWSKLPPEEEIAFNHADSLRLYQEHLRTPFALPIMEQSA